MTHKAAKPAACGARTGSGIVLLGSWNSPENSLNRLELQAGFLARRYALPLSRAKLVAELAFDGRRA
ncbi:hypothetical protein [Methylocella sp.]|uniref:hypothetical protein n=1 Tax=Methylocella sp. TaxID=1978226 RepID=UPI0035B1EBA3